MTEDTAAWWVYLLQCNDQSLYVGITTDLQRRLQEHSNSRSAAAQREAAIRKLSRIQKEQLIQAFVGDPTQ